MARRTETVVIDDEKSRDHGKSYLITEMDSEKSEWWAFRVMQGILGSDAEVNFNAPLAQMAGQGFKALASMPQDLAKPLLDEMMTCIKIPVTGSMGGRDLLPGDIEEVATRAKLRLAIFELHTGFSMRGGE